jgi:hypothetical protein
MQRRLPGGCWALNGYVGVGVGSEKAVSAAIKVRLGFVIAPRSQVKQDDEFLPFGLPLCCSVRCQGSRGV